MQDDDFLNAHFRMYFGDQVDYNRRYFYHDDVRYFLLDRYFIPQNVNTDELTAERVFEYIESLKQGIQCWNQMKNPEYTDFSDEQSQYLINLCNRKGLYKSGGSDYHGLNKPKISLAKGYGNLNINKKIIEDWI